jgi:phytoene desaturase
MEVAMPNPTVLIIGAGLAGLSAGCYAQMNGYRARIFEHHRVAGGVAACWQRGDYLIDGGIHFLMGYKPGTALHEVYHELGCDRLPSVDMTHYGRFIDETGGRRLDVTADLDRLAADLKAISPVDSPLIDELMAGARAFRGLDITAWGLGQPPELQGPIDRVKDMWQMRALWKNFTGRHAQSMADFTRDVRDPWLRDVLLNLFLPDAPVWFVFMLLALLADGQLSLLAGGCSDFVGALERRFRGLGGEIAFRATVEEILVENDRAVGVRLTDRTVHRGDAVVSAADGYSTLFGMLGGRYLTDAIHDRYDKWKLFRPLVMISFGVTREFAGQPSFFTAFLKHPFTVNDRPVRAVFVRLFNYSDQFAPAGKSVVQVGFESDWDSWAGLRERDREAYEAEKERLAVDALRWLEHHYPGLSSQIEVSDVATPFTTWRYTLNYRGSFEGWLMSPDQVNVRVERTLPGLSGFYMAGQWVMPGGGVSACLYSGRHAAQLLCRRDGKEFVLR